MNIPRFYKNKKNRGQATVELALAFPIFMMLVFGIFEGGRLLFIYTSIAAAGREAARYAAGIGQIASASSTLYNDCDGIRDAAIRIGSLAGVKAGDISIFHDAGPGSTVVPYCRPGDPPITINLNDRIVVRTATAYNPIVPLIPFPEMILRSENAHTLIKEAPVVAIDPDMPTVGETCNNTNYKINISNPTGEVVHIQIVNENPSIETRHIEELVVVWDGPSSPSLIKITKEDGTDLIAGINALPLGTLINVNSYNWQFNSGTPPTPFSFNLVFSKPITNLIVTFSLDNKCLF